MKRFFIGFLVLCPLLGSTAYADSDGYYCVGDGYIAYQFGFAAPPVGPHHLYIVRFGGTSGIEAPAVLDRPQFQLQGILCGVRTVQLAAYDAIYTVQLDSTRRPTRYDTAPWADHQNIPPEFVGQSLNLGAWTRAVRDVGVQREAVGTVTGGGRYLLEITSQAIDSEKCAWTIRTRLVKTDRNGREVQQLQIFQGRAARTCERGD